MRDTAVKGILVSFLYAGLFAVLTSCSVGGAGPDDDDSEGGIIGTGLILQGTVTDVRAFASNTLLIKSRTGEVSRALIGDAGRFHAPNVSGSPPYLLRADLGNSEFRYGIAFDNEIANVHSYTDVTMRNWFASGNGDIDFEFDQQTFTTTLPSRSQYQQNAGVFFSIVRLVLDSYQLTGELLLTGDYDANSNNYGIHSYLRNNSIFIQDDKIGLVITDPKTEVQSTTKSEFSVFEVATDADSEPPMEPDSVRALPSASNEIVLVWELAADNRGVVGYDVYREGVLVATTPYPVYTDVGLEPDLLYTYEVVSIDASNNRSALSLPATSGTLGEADNIAPSAPVQLSITAKTGRMNLLWGQSRIGDVVGFDVYRGRDNRSVEFLTSVTSSTHADVTVSSGTLYCYQIVARDAAGNESTKSDEVCDMSVGNVVTRILNEDAPQVPADAGLNIPDTQNMACTTNLDSYVIDSSVSIDAGCYLVDESIDVINGGNLSLAPGTVLKFGAGTGVLVGEGGSFTSEGSKSQPVVLTAQDPTPGYWNGIDFYNSNSTRNTLMNSVVEFAGNGPRAAAVSLRAKSSSIARVGITGSVIRECVGTGIRATDTGSNLAKLDGSVISGCDSPLTVDVQGLQNTTQRNEFLQNRRNWIDLESVAITSDTMIKNLGVPYIVSDIRIHSGNLSVAAGVELKFREGGQLLVNGSLTANGSVNDAVVFTGTLEEPGHWVGIIVKGTASFQHAELQFGGNSRNTVKPAALVVAGGAVEIEAMLISHSASLALHLAGASSALKRVEKLKILNNSYTINMPLRNIIQLGVSIEFENNTDSEITLEGSSITNSNIDIYHLGVPYLLEGLTNIISGKFSINAGVKLYMGDGAEIKLSQNSAFSVVGTADSPILLTHKSSIPGAWRGVNIYSDNTLNRMEYATVEFAGGSADSVAAAVRLHCTHSASLYLDNITIQDSANWGISLNDNEGCNLQLGDNVDFFRNKSGDISVP